MSAMRDIREAKYALFLGAGASAALVAFLKEQANGQFDPHTLLPTSSAFLDHLSGILEIKLKSSRARNLWASLSLLEHSNVEDLIRHLDILEQGMRVSSRLQHVETEAETAEELISDCKVLRNVIHEEIQSCYTLPHGENIDSLIAEFLHPIVLSLDSIFEAPCNSDVVIVTTNIDTVIEHYARSERGKERFSMLLDGFAGTDSLSQRAWEDDFHVGPSDRNLDVGKLLLVKLHGSVNWCSDEDTGQILRLPISLPSSVKYTIDSTGSMFLYPAYVKDIAGKRIYSDLFYHLDEHISSIPNWVFAGFAFKDSWINNALDHSLRRSSARKNLIVVNPSISTEDLPKAMKGAKLINVGFEVLGKLISPLHDIQEEREGAASSARNKAHVVATGKIGIKLSRPNLLAYWRLTSESVDLENRLAIDIGPDGLDGIVAGAEFKQLPGLFFDGHRAFIDVGAHEQLLDSKEMTILARVALANLDMNRDQVILASQGESDADFIFGVSPGNHLFLEPNPWPHMFDLALSDLVIPDTSDHWVGVTANWEKEGELLVGFYLDGAKAGEEHSLAPGKTYPLFPGQSKVWNHVSIGASMPRLDLFFGFLRDVQLYSTVLSESDIKELHNPG